MQADGDGPATGGSVGRSAPLGPIGQRCETTTTTVVVNTQQRRLIHVIYDVILHAVQAITVAGHLLLAGAGTGKNIGTTHITR